MNKNKYIFLTVIILSALFVSACNLPTGTSATDVDATTIASTAAAVFTHAAETAVITVGVPSATTEPEATALPTNTSIPTVLAITATKTPIPCNRGSFVKDVTIPDGAEIAAGDAFTKTWRIKNNGSCTWGANYVVLFDSGEQMGALASSPLGASVAPGSTIDISVNLTAPANPGNYQGNFKLRSHDNIVFGVNADAQGPFWVKIVVPNPLLPPAIAQVTLNSIAGESASVLSDGTVKAQLPNVGDNGSDQGSQAFISFDISGIAADATITEVKVDFSSYDTLGSPFANLGCLRMYPQNYQPIDASDYTAPAPGALVRWCSTGDLSAVSIEDGMKAEFQSTLGATRFQVRIQFNETETNTDAIADMVRLNKSNINLIVTYTSP